MNLYCKTIEIAPIFRGGGEYWEFEKVYVSGLANSTNSEHKDYWGKIVDYDQKIVENAAVYRFISFAKQCLSLPLSVCDSALVLHQCCF